MQQPCVIVADIDRSKFKKNQTVGVKASDVSKSKSRQTNQQTNKQKPTNKKTATTTPKQQQNPKK